MRFFVGVCGVWVVRVLAWVNPDAPVAPVFNALTRPFLRPLRRVVPAVGRVDLSPLVLLMILWVLLILIDGLARMAGQL